MSTEHPLWRARREAIDSYVSQIVHTLTREAALMDDWAIPDARGPVHGQARSDNRIRGREDLGWLIAHM